MRYPAGPMKSLCSDRSMVPVALFGLRCLAPALGRWVADLSDGWVTCAAPSLASPPAAGVALLAEQTTGAGIAHPAGILSQPLAPACAAAGTRTQCPAAALNLSPSWRERPSRLFLLARLGGFLIGSGAAVSAAR